MAIVERRKTVKGLVAFSVRISPELKEKLEEMAYKNKRSLGMTVEDILENAVTPERARKKF